MHLSIVSRHLPQAEGTSPGRALLASVEGMLANGHTVDVWCWGPEPPVQDLPAWCRWRPLPSEAYLRMKARALVRPRFDVTIGGWAPQPGAVALADDPVSFPAVERFPRSVLTQHYLTSLDRIALRTRQLRDIQDLRAERRNARRADAIVAYSERVARALSARAIPVPIAYPAPPVAVDPVERPVALLLADWRWPPNVAALRELARSWPAVLSRVPDVELLIAGRGLRSADVPPLGRCRVIGEVPTSRDALRQAAVLAFPCPETSGPKVKVVEALAHGVPVVTTPAGAEGVAGGSGVAVAHREAFAAVLADVLCDPARRRAMAVDGRRAVVASHAAVPAAAARVAAIRRGLGTAEMTG